MPYSCAVDNTPSLKNTAAIAKIGTFDSSTNPINPYPVALRANLMTPPAGGAFGAYLVDATARE